MPESWTGFTIHYRYRETVYHVHILQNSGQAGMTIDGEAREIGAVPMVDDRRDHQVEIRLAPAPQPPPARETRALANAQSEPRVG